MEIICVKQHKIVIDDTFSGEIKSRKWYVIQNGKTYYAKTSVRRSDGSWTSLGMHQLVLMLAGRELGCRTDHRDGNGLNNQLSNLRPANSQQNGRNRKLNGNNTSGFKGVTRQARSNKWHARIKAGSTVRYLGGFATPEEAARAYDDAALELHGEFARLNFSEPCKATE